ncbi:MAG: M2 family metallopeptidase [Acidimicrobiia bacterium]
MTCPVDLVEQFTTRLAPLERTANEVWWAASTEVSEDHEAARVEADLALRDALADTETYAETAGWADIGDPNVARQLRVLHDRMRPHQVSASTRDDIVRLEARLDAAFNGFRPELDGETVDDNTIADLLRHSDDADQRQRAWFASKSVGAAVADSVRELAHLRNRSAHELGARDYFALALETSELDEARLVETLDAVDRATAEPFREWKHADDIARSHRFGCDIGALRPWHYDDPFFQSAPRTNDLDLDAWFADADLVELTRSTYTGIGIDIDPALERSDLLPRPGKSQHAFCIDVDHAGDVRVLCNNVAGSYWTETMLHEFGHAAYDLGVSPALPELVRTMHPLTTEGIAMLFGRLTLDPEWLVRVAGVPAAEVDAARPALARRRRSALLVFSRWVLVMTHFERGFYADPDADHDTRWWDLVERFQVITRPDGRHAPDWAAKLHVALAPVYYQNYLLGELVASQLQATLVERFGGVIGRPEVGAFLQHDVFAPGWSVRWDQLVEAATGSPLRVDAFAAELAALGVHATSDAAADSSTR